MPIASLTDQAVDILATASPLGKVNKTKELATLWQAEGTQMDVGEHPPPERPARPERPLLLPPREMPRRRMGTLKGRCAMLHAIAHIELNAIDLAWDILVRFQGPDLPKAFYDDWVQVAYDEAIHFEILEARLQELGYSYGDFPAHDGLWDAALQTNDDLMARLALVPMLLEPRGLDTTPQTVERLNRLGDSESAKIMERIGREEIDHVAAGTRWFEFLAHKRNLPCHETYHDLVKTRFKGALKPPFNHEARTKAGMSPQYYEPLAQNEFLS